MVLAARSQGLKKAQLEIVSLKGSSSEFHSEPDINIPGCRVFYCAGLKNNPLHPGIFVPVRFPCAAKESHVEAW